MSRSYFFADCGLILYRVYSAVPLKGKFLSIIFPTGVHHFVIN